ncbi:Os05g0356500 [Oryza sativa Japonica Group]|uniref:CLE family OsCLE504 protein n=3 Tax=Oryza sativa TaxID=4530 RepID=A8R3P8_ORYSJ|nr:hypothetical protein OsI_19608 [Oryza sativa Indica Group]EEE63390.1 hypothetical protein OsJ_18202 [Oryza sativa Japonica Group]KAB8099060.1 hypothetical protein EE612_028907 [Oryza sativa]BAF91626.1 CLE family OsCLE504 protein [Oryza sativa Japonica Group]BAS93571.1 Os05g0356500 [Oryza sativa Japonica Group]
MATTHAQRRRCLLFMALVFAVAVAAVAAARPPPSFSGTADGDDGNVLVAAAGSRGNRVGIMHDVPSGPNPIHNDHPPPHHPPSSSRVRIMHDVPSGPNPIHNHQPSP